MNIYELDFRFGSPHGLPTFREKHDIFDGFVGSLVGGLLGLGAAESSGSSAVEAQRLANESNERIAREQRDWSERMIDEQNRYNSPVAQKERYLDAGINPYMAMQSGSLTSGNQSQLPSYQRASIQSAAPLILQAGIAKADIMQKTTSQLLQGFQVESNVLLQAAQTANTAAETDFFLRSMKDRLRQVNLLTTNMELQNTRAGYENDILKVQSEIQNKYGLSTAEWNLNGMVQQVYESLAREGLLTTQGQWTEADIGRIDAQIKLFGEQVITEAYKRLNLAAGAENQRAQASLAGTQEGLVQQQTRLTASEADIRETSIPYIISGVKSTAAMKRLEQRILSNEAEISDASKKYRKRDIKTNSWRNVLRLGNDAFDTFTKPQRYMMDMMEQGSRTFGNIGFGRSMMRTGSHSSYRSYDPQRGWSYGDRYDRYDYNNFNNW